MINKILCKLRNVGFWGLDMLKGEQIKTAYKEIKKIDELNSDDEFIKMYKEKKFFQLAKHATTTTNFYNNFKENPVLDNFPVINKDIIKKYEEDFLSNNYKKENLFQMSTSGSTGTPFISYQDKDKKRRVIAEVIYYSEKSGYSVGNNLIFLRALTEKSRKSKFQQWVQNESLIDISDLSDKKIESILSEINKVSKNGSMILAYASTFDVLKDYFQRFGSKMSQNVTGLVSSSEMLFDETRISMKKEFNCNMVSRYSNQENGIIGQDENLNNTFILNEANYIVEIFDLEKDVVVSNGTIGRIIITDLYNKAMPLIRYDTGDIGSLIFIKHGNKLKKAINNFGGRKIDIVEDSYGNRLSPHTISNNMWKFTEIQQYQFIQEESYSYLIKVIINKEFEHINDMKIMLMELLGEHAKVSIKIVNEIPELKSGKKKYIMNKTKK